LAEIARLVNQQTYKLQVLLVLEQSFLPAAYIARAHFLTWQTICALLPH